MSYVSAQLINSKYCFQDAKMVDLIVFLPVCVSLPSKAVAVAGPWMTVCLLGCLV